MSNTPLSDKLQKVRTLLVEAVVSKDQSSSRMLAKQALEELGHTPKKVKVLEETLNGAMALVKEQLGTVEILEAAVDLPTMDPPFIDLSGDIGEPLSVEDVQISWEDEKKPETTMNELIGDNMSDKDVKNPESKSVVKRQGIQRRKKS